MIRAYKAVEEEISCCDFCRNIILDDKEYVFDSILDISRDDIVEGYHEKTVLSLCEKCYIALIELKPFLDKNPGYTKFYKIGGSIDDNK